MTKLTTTLARIKAHNPCEDGLEQLLTHIGSDYPEDKEIDLLTILESNGIEYFFWAFRAVEDEELGVRIPVELAIKFAERVLPIFEKEYPDDNRPRMSIEAAKAWLKRSKKVANFSKFYQAAWRAKWGAFWKDLLSAAWAADAAAWTASVAECAAEGMEKNAAQDVCRVASAANRAVGETKESEAFKAERQAQIEIIKEVLS